MEMTQCEIGKIGLIDENIMLIDIDCEKKIEVDHICELNYEVHKLARFNKLYSIINYGAYSFPTKEAREMCAKEEVNNHILARAIVVHDLGQLIIAKHTIKQRKSNVPTRIFMEMRKAQRWVHEMKAKNIDNQSVA